MSDPLPGIARNLMWQGHNGSHICSDYRLLCLQFPRAPPSNNSNNNNNKRRQQQQEQQRESFNRKRPPRQLHGPFCAPREAQSTIAQQAWEGKQKRDNNDYCIPCKNCSA